MIISSGLRLATPPVLIGWSAFLTRERASRGARIGCISEAPCFVTVLAALRIQRTELSGSSLTRYHDDENKIRCY